MSPGLDLEWEWESYRWDKPGKEPEIYVETNVRRDGGEIGTGIGRLGQELEDWDMNGNCIGWNGNGNRTDRG